MQNHFLEYFINGDSRVRCSYFEAIDDIVKEIAWCDQYAMSITVLEYLNGWNIDQIDSHKWCARNKSGKKALEFDNHRLSEMIITAFSSKSLSAQQLCDIYTTVFWVDAVPVKGARLCWELIQIETEMDHFHCIQCGNCCLNLNDAYCTSCTTEDYNRWQAEGRTDILEYIEFGDLWISPITGDEVDRCPWLRKVRNKDRHCCRIHETKPKHCREFPKTKRHALLCGCRGFGENPKGSDYYFSKYRRI